MKDRFVMLNGLRFHYLETGRAGAPGFLILHGFGAHARDWEHVAAWLADRYHVLALDQRGFGESAWAPDRDYSLQANAQDIAALVDDLAAQHAAWRRPVLLGFSLGARHALYYAGANPQRVERLVLVDMGPEVAAAGQARTRKMAAEAPERFSSVEEAMAAFRPNYPFFRDDLYRRRIAYNLVAGEDGSYRLRWDPAFRTLLGHAISSAGAPQIDLWESLKRVTCPIIEIMGEQSDVITPDIARRMVAMNPGVQLATIPGATHTVHGDNPDEFCRVLLAFLA